MKNKISQTATEYLILLAVVIVVALVVVNTMGVFPGIGSSSNKKISDQKLASDVVGVTSYFIGDSYSIFNLKNNNYDTITVTEFRINQQANLTCNSSNTIPALPAVLNIGQSVTINCSVVNTSSYTLSDRKTPLIGILYIDSLGATRLAGNVLTYDAVSLSSGNQSGGSTSNSTISGPVNGLVAYYPFDGNISDMSGNGFNGNCTGATCPTLNGLGVIGSDAYFTAASSQNIKVLSNNSLKCLGNCTLSVWVYPTQVANNAIYLADGTIGDTGWAFWITNQARIIYRASVGNLYGSTTLSTNKWYHLTYVIKNNTRQEIYVNGVLDGSANNAWYAINTNKNTTIGFDPVYSYPFSGAMDEIRFYNRSLNSSEISDLYNLGSANASRVLAMDFNSNGLNYLNLNYSNRSLYEQGISIQDNSIYNYSGTSSGLTKQYWWNGNTAGTSVINGSLQFDGVNDYVNLGDINSFVSGTDNLPFSISAWIKMVGNSTAIVSRGNLASPNREYYFYVSSGNLTFRLKDMTVGGTPEAIVLGNQTLNADIWYNVIATYDGNDTSPSSGMNVYINGVNSSTARLTESGFIAMRNQASNIFRVGSLTWGTFVSPVSFYANGSIDDVIVFSRALNATEISTIYTEGLAGRTVGMDLSSNDSRTIPATNRVAYWSFNNNDFGNATDSWGGNNGSCTGVGVCPTWNTSGVFGSASYSFNGANNVITVNSNVTNNLSSITVSTWVYFNSFKAFEAILATRNSNNNYLTGFSLDSVMGNGIDAYLDLGTVNVNIWTARTFSLGQWHHLVMTFGSLASGGDGKVKLYVDGVNMVNSSVQTSNFTVQNRALYFGKDTYDSARNLNGSLDEVMIFNRSLNSSEVIGLYDNGRKKLHLQLDNLSGTSATDSSLSQATGTLTNYPTTATTAPIWNATGGRNGTGAYVFDGSQVIVTQLTNLITNTGIPVTISVWFNLNNYSDSAYQTLVAKRHPTDNAGQFMLQIASNNIAIQSYSDVAPTGTQTIVTTESPLAGLTGWHQVTFVKQWGTTNYTAIYLDGVSKLFTGDDTKGGTSYTSNPVTIGAGYTGSVTPNYFRYANGSIDNVQIFNRALNSTEILALYNSP